MIEVRKRNGFSLAEMMVVMLMVAIVLAATAPMITRKISRERSDKIFDMLNIDPTNAVEYIKGRKQRIYMNAKANGYVGIRESGDTIPTNSVLFGYNKYTGSDAARFVGIGFNTTNAVNSIAIGYNASATADSVAIGSDAERNTTGDTGTGVNFVAIGAYAGAGTDAVAVGYNASASMKSVAIGYGAKALNPKTMAIGYNASVNSNVSGNAMAIGYDAYADKKQSMVLGTEKDTVYIPGNLIVGKTTAVGVKAASDGKSYPLYVLAHSGHDGDGRHFTDMVNVMEANHADDYKGGNDWANVMISGSTPGIQVGPYIFQHSTKYSKDNQKWCPPKNNSSDWYRIKNGSCNSVNSSSDNTLLWSDAQLKNIGEAYTGGLNELSQLDFYHYTFKDDEEKTSYVGVIAQDLQKVFPTAVKKAANGYLTIRWDEMFYAAINAIKELNTKVCALAENVQNIIKDITDLKTVTEKQQAVIESQAKTLTEQQTELKNLSARVEKLEKKRK